MLHALSEISSITSPAVDQRAPWRSRVSYSSTFPFICSKRLSCSPLSTLTPGKPNTSSAQAKTSTLQSTPFQNCPPDNPTVQQSVSLHKDFTYLQQPSAYHPLIPQILPQSLQHPPSTAPLQTLLSTSHLRSAALSAAQTLCTHPSLSAAEIFDLVYVRLACLSLLDLNLAAQESKVLGDVNSEFYHTGTVGVEGEKGDVDYNDGDGEKSKGGHDVRRNILPWELRVLAVRLQAIGYGDARAGVVGYYELAREAREMIGMIRRSKQKGHASKGDEGEEEKGSEEEEEEEAIWHRRLKELGIMVGNALIEMGDLAAAKWHLETLAPPEDKAAAKDEMLSAQLALLSLQMGDIQSAERHLASFQTKTSESPQSPSALLNPLISISQSFPDSSTSQLRTILSSLASSSPYIPLVTSNLAISLLYDARIEDAIPLLEDLMEQHSEVVKGVGFNLATMYELTGERAAGKKLEFANAIDKRLEMRGEAGIGERGITGGVFKL